MEHRPGPRGGQREADQIPQQAVEHELHGKTQGASGDTGRQTEQGKLTDEQGHQLGLSGPQAAHHRTSVQMALHKAPGRQADGHGGQHHGEHRRKAQEALGAIQDGAHFGAGVVHGLQGLAALQAGLGPGLEGCDVPRLTGQVQAMESPAAGLDQRRGRQIRRVDDQPRQQAEEIGAPVRLEGQHRGHAQA